MKRLFTIMAFCAAALASAGSYTAPAKADGLRYSDDWLGQIAVNIIFGDDRAHGRQTHKPRRNRDGDRHRNHGYRGDRDSHHKHTYKDGRKRRHKLHRHGDHRHRHGHKSHARRHHDHGLHLGQHRRHAAGSACHPVRKFKINRHGDRVLVRGVLCTDGYGTPYIVPGSRRVVHRY